MKITVNLFISKGLVK